MPNHNDQIRSRLYIAGPLFSEAEKVFNKKLKTLLQPYFEVYLPQEDGGLMVEMIKDGMPQELATKRVFSTDIEAMEKCSFFLIILDGRSVDEGAAFELGFAFSKGKPCYGLKTDPRQLLPYGNNPMISCSIKEIFSSVQSLMQWAKTMPSIESKNKKKVR